MLTTAFCLASKVVGSSGLPQALVEAGHSAAKLCGEKYGEWLKKNITPAARNQLEMILLYAEKRCIFFPEHIHGNKSYPLLLALKTENEAHGFHTALLASDVDRILDHDIERIPAALNNFSNLCRTYVEGRMDPKVIDKLKQKLLKFRGDGVNEYNGPVHDIKCRLAVVLFQVAASLKCVGSITEKDLMQTFSLIEFCKDLR